MKKLCSEIILKGVLIRYFLRAMLRFYFFQKGKQKNDFDLFKLE